MRELCKGKKECILMQQKLCTQLIGTRSSLINCVWRGSNSINQSTENLDHTQNRVTDTISLKSKSFVNLWVVNTGHHIQLLRN